MIKHFNEWEIKCKLSSVCQVNFFRCKKSCSNDYVKPLLRSSPESFHLAHWYKRPLIGYAIKRNSKVNNWPWSDRPSEEIARSITHLATTVKKERHDFSTSNIKIQPIDKKPGEKRREVSSFLGRIINILLVIPRELKETISAKESYIYIRKVWSCGVIFF